MNIISLICVLIFFLLIASLLKKDADIFSPIRLFAIIWSLSIGLAELKLSRFQQSWTAYSYIVLLTCVCGTLIGMYVIFVINYNKKIYSLKASRIVFTDYKINDKYLFRAAIIVFVCYIVSYYVTYLIQGYIPFFTFNPDTTRTRWGGIFGIGLLIQAIPSILYFIILYFLFVKRNLTRKVILLLVTFTTLITYLFILQRYFFILILILFFVCAYYSTKLMRKRNVIILLSLVGIVLYGVSSLRVSRYAFNILYMISDMRISPDYAIITEPYMYIVMNLENFARASNNLGTYSYGLFTFDFVLALTGIKASLSEYLRAQQFPYIITNSFNTYTMYFAFYRDYGIWGTGILSFLFGAVVSASYYRLKRRPDLNSVSIYALLVFVVIFSFFIPILSWLIFVFNIMLIYYVTKKIQVEC